MVHSRPSHPNGAPAPGPPRKGSPMIHGNHTADNLDPSRGAFKAQLQGLLPKHTQFHVRVKIHQLSSVPLVHGAFGVRWKFKNSQHQGGIFGRSAKGKGKEKEVQPPSDDPSSSSLALEDNTPMDSSQSLSIPSVVVSNSGHTRNTSTSSGSIAPPPADQYEKYYSNEWLPSSFVAQRREKEKKETEKIALALSASAPVEEFAHSKGITEFKELYEHNVVWEHTLDVVVEMDVHRETLDLQPSELKLVVMQRVVAGDPEAPHNPRLGCVYINLAEYATAGPVTRRYLLRESKTNATLRLTIQMEHFGGEAKFKAPPLPKSEVLGGVAGLLESDVYQIRPRTLNLYEDEVGAKTKKATPSKKAYTYGSGTLIMDVTQTYGPTTTEDIIEALFNPKPTSDTAKLTPFTYYQKPRKPIVKKDDASRVSADRSWDTMETLERSPTPASLYSVGSGEGTTATATTTSAASIRSKNSNHSTEGDRGLKARWFKMGSSRPTTPVPPPGKKIPPSSIDIPPRESVVSSQKSPTAASLASPKYGVGSYA